MGVATIEFASARVGQPEGLLQEEPWHKLGNGVNFRLRSGGLDQYSYLPSGRDSILGQAYIEALRAHLPPEVAELHWNLLAQVHGYPQDPSASYAIRPHSPQSITFGTGVYKAKHRALAQGGLLNPRGNSGLRSAYDLDHIPLLMRLSWSSRFLEGYTPKDSLSVVERIVGIWTTGGADFDTKHDPDYWHQDLPAIRQRALASLETVYGSHELIDEGGEHPSIFFYNALNPNQHEVVARLGINPLQHLEFTNPNLSPAGVLRVGRVPVRRKISYLSFEQGLANDIRPRLGIVTMQSHMTPIPMGIGDYTDLRMGPVNSLADNIARIHYPDAYRNQPGGLRFIQEGKNDRFLRFNSEITRNLSFALADLIRGLRLLYQRDMQSFRWLDIEPGRTERDIMRDTNIPESELNLGLLILSPQEYEHIRNITLALSQNTDSISPTLADELTADLGVIPFRSPNGYITTLRLSGLSNLLTGWQHFSSKELIEMNSRIIGAYPQFSSNHLGNAPRGEATIDWEIGCEHSHRQISVISSQNGRLKLSIESSPMPHAIIIDALEEMLQEKGVPILGNEYSLGYRWRHYNRPIHAQT